MNARIFGTVPRQSRLGESINYVLVLKEQLETEEKLWAKFIESNNIQFLSGAYHESDIVLTSLYTIQILILTTSLWHRNY